MHEQSTKLQWGLAIVCERRAHRQAVASNRRRLLVIARDHASLNLAHATRILLELGLGVPVGLSDRFGSFFEIVELAQLVRNARQDLLHRHANWALGIRNDGVDRHRQGLFDLT